MSGLLESAELLKSGLELQAPLQFFVRRNGELQVEPHEEELPGAETAYLALFSYLFGALPASVYEPACLRAVREAEEIVRGQAIVSVEATQAQLRTLLRQRAVELYLGRPQVDFPSKTTNLTLKRVKNAFPFHSAFRPDFFLSPPRRFAASQKIEAFTEGSFSELWEERLAASTVLPARGVNASHPFHSLRDFVLSLLPRHLPIRSYTEDLWIKHPSGNPDLDGPVQAAVNKERAEVFAALCSCFPELGTICLDPLGPEEAFAVVSRYDWKAVAVDHREIETLHERILRVLPEMFARIQEGVSGGHPMKRLRHVPRIKASDLEEWGRLNGLSAEELAALVDYLNEEKPKNLTALRTLIRRLFMNTSALRRTEQGITQRGVVFWEEGLQVDPWTFEFLTQVSQTEKGAAQTLIFQTQGKRSELQLGRMVKEHKESPWASVDVERFEFLAKQLGEAPNPEESLRAFEALFVEIFGSMEKCSVFLMHLQGQLARPVELSSEGTITVLSALLPGYLKVVWRVLCEGLGTQGELPETAVRGAEVAEKYQDCVAILVGSNGFGERTDQPACLKFSAANDFAQLVTTEYNYYRNRPDLISKGLGKYLHSVGALSSKEAGNLLTFTPVGVYSLAKRFYLDRDYTKTVKFVALICDLDRMDGYHAEVANQWADLAPSFEQKTGKKLGKLGLSGYARVMVGEADFTQELLRMGVLSANQLLARGAGSPALEAQRQDWSTGFELIKRGPLTTSQVVNFHLAQAQFLRNRGCFLEADLEIERGWDVLEGAPEGYLQRRIEHNEVEIAWERMSRDEALQPTHLPKLIEMAIKERQLTQEEKENGHPMRIWEYAATYFQVLMSLASLPLPEEFTTPSYVDRRNGRAFETRDFCLERLDEFLLTASREAIDSARELHRVQANDARGAVQVILGMVRALSASPQIQKLPLLTEWEALAAELAPKKA